MNFPTDYGVLSDTSIRNLLKQGQLISGGVDDLQIQPASIDVRLGNSFYIYDKVNYAVNLRNNPPGRGIISNTVAIAPHSFCLATTKEYVKLPANISAFIDGRSSVGRSGIFVENAGWIDPGFEGEITLELFNATENTIVLDSGTRIAQIVFMWTDTECTPYSGKYNHQTGATTPELYKDFEVTGG